MVRDSTYVQLRAPAGSLSEDRRFGGEIYSCIGRRCVITLPADGLVTPTESLLNQRFASYFYQNNVEAVENIPRGIYLTLAAGCIASMALRA